MHGRDGVRGRAIGRGSDRGEGGGRRSRALAACVVCLLVTAASLAAPRDARAIAGPGAAATANFPYVGRVQLETTALNDHACTGSYIRQSVVLTAAHCINEDAASNVVQRFERFQPVGGIQYFGLGVQEPRYNAAAAVSDHDVGLLLLLNGPAAPAGGFPTLAGAGDRALAAGDVVEVIGFTGSAAGGNPLRGTMKLNAAGDVMADRYVFTAAPNFTQPGDSGGPYVFDYGAAGGGKKIVATNQGGGVTKNGIRVDTHRSFIDGDGQGGMRVIDRLGGAGDTNFSAAASWQRGSANAAAVPLANDVVVLDPTTKSDRGRTVTLDVNSPALDGLVNDVTLKVQDRTLNVTAAVGTTGNSGVLNGGVIEVGGGAGTGVVNISRSLDNESSTNAAGGTDNGMVNIRKNGTVNIGAGLTGNPDTAVWAGANSEVNVFSGGRLSVTNANGTALYSNRAMATLRVEGGADGNGTARLDALVNLGTVNVNDGGRLTMSRSIAPGGRLALDNQAGGAFNVNPGGQATVAGNAMNTGTVTIAANAASGAGILFANADPTGAKGTFTNNGTLTFNAGGGTTNPQFVTFNADFAGTGAVNGTGTFVMTADSNFNLQTTAANAALNLNRTDILWDSAFTAGAGPVTMEALSVDHGGNDVTVFNTDPFALHRMCLTGMSMVQLVDVNSNEGVAGSEVLYTLLLGVQAGSVLDLNGETLYYFAPDPACGGLAGTILLHGGHLILVPEPASLVLLAAGLAVVILSPRRRARAGPIGLPRTSRRGEGGGAVL